MMQDTSEIKALLHLLDDPDEEIYQTVSTKLKHYGKEIIPTLESFGEQTTNIEVHEKIEHLIHDVNYKDILIRFKKWFNDQNGSLLDGSMLLTAYLYADFDNEQIHKTIKSIYQSCWLEVNNYLTPLEQINVINSIFYSMYKFTGFDLEANKPSHYFINEVLDTRNGNNYSLGILYQIICDKLDIPVFAIQLPKQFLLAYFSTQFDFFKKEETTLKIQFFIDPNNGNIYTQNDVDVYLKKYNLKTDEYTYLPLSNHQNLYNQLEALSQVYSITDEEEKAAELQKIMSFKA